MNKLIPLVVLSAFAFGPGAGRAQETPASPAGGGGDPPAEYVITERGAHERTWSRISWETNRHGQLVAITNAAYVELETGMHYWKDGQWQETQAEIALTSEGAAATKGPHTVFFASNLNTAGAIDLTTPDGKRLRSRVVGLSYFDASSGKAVLIAETKDSTGQLVPPNQVLYTNAFDGVPADVQCVYTRAGFEQNIILRAQPPAPGQFGLDPSRTALQVLTEFYDPPVPVQTPISGGAGGVDTLLDFGAMQIGRGQAYAVGEAEGPGAELPVCKHWTVADGRTFLVEAVPFELVAEQAQGLPESAPIAALELHRRGTGPNVLAALSSGLPGGPVKPSRGEMRVAQVATTEGRGFVLDYTLLTSQANVTLQGDTTYYVSGTVNLSGTTTVEGGAVVKYTNSAAAKVNINGTVACLTGPYRPAVFTSKDDDSVGETISGSTSDPATNFCGNPMLLVGDTAAHLKYVRIAYAATALRFGYWSQDYVLSHAQLLNCQLGIYSGGDDDNCFALHNVLFSKVAQFGDGNMASLCGEHVTLDQVTNSGVISVTLTNSLIVSSSGFSGGTSNAYLSSASGVFQTVGAGSYYLYDNTYRNAGTTNISAELARDLRSKTTFPPVEIASQTISSTTCWTPHVQRDNDLPDLGYHYDPLDYVVNAVTVSAQLTLASGVAVGTYGSSFSRGLYLFNGSLASEGAPTRLNWIVRYNTVQEQSTANWAASTVGSGVEGASSAGAVQVRFTGWSLLGGAGRHFNYYSDGATVPAFSHCQFGGGDFLLGPGSVALTNCLWQRVRVFLDDDDNDPEWYLYNNLFAGGKLVCSLGNAVMQAYDNLFDRTIIYQSGTITHDYNGYVTNQNRLSPDGAHDVILTNSPVYQTGYLGCYYYPANDGHLSRLLDVGSRAASAAGLCRYTIITNQTQEGGSQVDIGFHYAPVQGAVEIAKSGITASASSSESGYQPDKAIDNSDFDPGWQSAYEATFPWVRLDLGASNQVVRLDYQQPEFQSSYRLTSYEVYVTDTNSANPGDWGAPAAMGTWYWQPLNEARETKVTEFNKGGRYVILRSLVSGVAAVNELWVYRTSSADLTYVAADTDTNNLPDYLEGCEPLDFTNAIGLRVDVQDSSSMGCGGINGGKQIVEATNQLSGGTSDLNYILAVTVEGSVETFNPNFDFVCVNGIEFFKSTLNLQTDCTMTNVAKTKYVTVAGNDKIVLRYNTRDGQWHHGAYAQITDISLVGGTRRVSACEPYLPYCDDPDDTSWCTLCTEPKP